MVVDSDSAVGHGPSRRAAAGLGRGVPGSLGLVVLVLVCVLVAPGIVFGQVAGGAGAIRGTVRDADFDIPLAGVRVTVVGRELGTESRPDGTFLIDGVPPGRYTLSFAKLGYQRYVETGVVVTAGQLADVQVVMGAEVYEMQEMVVTGQDLLAGTEIAQLEIRAEALTLQDAISAELMSRAGVGDVADALNLVVGATVVDGKYATVRGLSDRYTGTTVNGVSIPSSDPRKRAVQLDVFPTGTIDAVTVTKTFSPDLPGDFTGGGVDIKTKSIPEDMTFRMGLSLKYDDLATNNDAFLTYVDGGVDPFLDSSNRELPEGLLGEIPDFDQINVVRPDAEDRANALLLEDLTESLAPAMGAIEEAPGIDRSFSIVGGDSTTLEAGDTFGFFGALSYSESRSFYDNGEANISGLQPGGEIKPFSGAFIDTQGTEEVLVGMLGSAAWRPDDRNEIGFTAVWNLSAKDEARVREWSGETWAGDGVGRVQSLKYIERSISSLQLRGRHEMDAPKSSVADLGDVLFDWTVALNSTNQEEPDTRQFKNRRSEFGDFVLGEHRWLSGSSSPVAFSRRVWRDIEETGSLVGVNLAIPFGAWDEREGQIKIGTRVEVTDRSLSQKSFYYRFNERSLNLLSRIFFSDNKDLYWTDIFTDTDLLGFPDDVGENPNLRELQWVIQTNTEGIVDYVGDREVFATYAMAEVPVTRSLTLTGGLRYETTEFFIVPRSPNGEVFLIRIRESQTGSPSRFRETVPEDEAIVDLSAKDFLPALNATYDITPEMKARVAYSRTIARPTFREISPVATLEYLEGDNFIGNPELEVSNITNYDVRWEWFPRPGDVIAFSAYYKKITNPIEFVAFAAGATSYIQPVNFEEGNALGFEVELRTTFGQLLPWDWKWTEDLSLGTNLTWIESEVELPDLEQRVLEPFGLDEETRALAGQPEYLFNFNLTYANEDWGTEASVFLNVIGERVLSGASKGAGGASVDRGGVPSVYEQSFTTLDFTASQKLSEHVSVSLKAKNLIAPEVLWLYRDPLDREAVRLRHDTAREYSVSVSMKW